jgi:AhpD family alkylhydroperoxidase
MARIALDKPSTLTGRAANWYARRQYGKEVDPILAMAHNTKVLRADAQFEMKVAKFDRLPKDLKDLAVMACSVAIGCSWCIDFGHWLTLNAGMDPRKVEDIVRWRESDAHTDLERAVIEFAEAATETPAAVRDELVERLRQDLDDAQLVELAMMVAVENLRSRFNSSLGLTSQGFKDSCTVPNAVPNAVRGTVPDTVASTVPSRG